MKSFTTFLLFISSFLSCTSTDKNKEKIVTFEDLLNTDSIARVDSMKWYYYAMNAKGRALFYDTIKQLGDTADPLECDAELTGFMQRNKDTSFYIFSFKKQNCRFRYVDQVIYISGMKIYKEQIIPIINHVVMEYESNIDSTNAVLKNSETIFTNYLKRHKGKIAPWLKNEAIRRKIL